MRDLFRRCVPRVLLVGVVCLLVPGGPNLQGVKSVRILRDNEWPTSYHSIDSMVSYPLTSSDICLVVAVTATKEALAGETTGASTNTDNRGCWLMFWTQHIQSFQIKETLHGNSQSVDRVVEYVTSAKGARGRQQRFAIPAGTKAILVFEEGKQLVSGKTESWKKVVRLYRSLPDNPVNRDAVLKSMIIRKML